MTRRCLHKPGGLCFRHLQPRNSRVCLLTQTGPTHFPLTLQPCLQCTVLYMATAVSLCVTGCSQYCVIPIEGFTRALNLTNTSCVAGW